MKKIMLVTSTRADWGLLRPVAQRIKESEKLQLCLAVTGTHLMKELGETVGEIEGDGFCDYIPADIMKFGFGDKATALTIAYTVQVFTEIIITEKPDLVLLLGDRYEIFAVCTASATLSVPVAHISGGDVTAGAKDDFYRHCITKMSSIHFPSCEDSRRRIIQLGEEPKTVFNVGGLGNENIQNVPLMSLEQLEDSLDFKNLVPFALITYHPQTQKGHARQDMENLLSALENTDINLIFTKSNADSGGDVINRMVDDYCQKHSHRAKAFFSLGYKRYLSAMKYCRLVLGNSSSGVVETPCFGVPRVNIGDRQKGRFTAENVINTTTDARSIHRGIQKALSEEFKAACVDVTNPYDAGFPASEKIVQIITGRLEEGIDTAKVFYDLK